MNTLTKFYIQLLNVLNSEEGQDLAEYGLVLLLVAVAAVAVIGLFGAQITSVFNSITSGLTPAS